MLDAADNHRLPNGASAPSAGDDGPGKTADCRRRPSPAGRGLRIWFRAVRAFSFTASVMPAVLAAALAVSSPWPVAWGLFPLAVLGALLFHAGTNLVSDAADYQRGIDRPGKRGGSGVLIEGLLTPEAVRRAGILLFAAGSLIGLVLVCLRGQPVLWLGLAGLAGGAFYGGRRFGYKYVALGDVMVFLLMGTGIVVGTYYVLTGQLDAVAVYGSLPVACLVTAILHGNNIRDIEQDIPVGARTLANVIGPVPAAGVYFFLVYGSYLAVVALMAARIVSPLALIVFLTLPLAVLCTRKVALAVRKADMPLDTIDIETARLHLLFTAFLSGAISVSGSA